MTANKHIHPYSSPRIKATKFKMRSVVCLSGNEPMGEIDYGNGGFSEA